MSSIDLKSFIRPHLREIETFSPADPPELQASKAGITEDQIVRLNANENPYGFSPRVAEAVASVPYNIYPDPFQRKVRAALSEFTGVPAERIIAGAGSDEIIDLIFRLVIEPGDKIIDSEPTFGMYSFDARVNGAETVFVQRDEKFDVDVDAVKEAIDERAKIIFLCSPNNPTGNVATSEQIEGLVETGLLVVIDEAYWEFSGSTAASMVKDHDNLIVLRTMSKWAGIAGLRIGYGIMSPTLVNHIIDIKQPYNVTTASEAALMATLEDAEYLDRNRDLIVSERERLIDLLNGIPGVKPWPSGGNYVLCEFQPGRAEEIFENMAMRGIFLRKFSSKRLRDFFRISVGTPSDTDAVIAALQEFV